MKINKRGDPQFSALTEILDSNVFFSQVLKVEQERGLIETRWKTEVEQLRQQITQQVAIIF